ncbi:hypothetical protein MMC29_005142, partial [Sticta canariensis]|nr:hypothetical protein [Sticta canariensis]
MAMSKMKTENNMSPNVELNRRLSFIPPLAQASLMPMNSTEQIKPHSSSTDWLELSRQNTEENESQSEDVSEHKQQKQKYTLLSSGFVTNFLAIIPLAAMLSYATEKIALRTRETIGGLLNASFGNAVELTVSVIAFVYHKVLIVQTSLISSMLSNLLLVLEMCFFFGGLCRAKHLFNITVAQTAASLLSLALASLIILTAFAAWPTGSAGEVKEHITSFLRATAILLFLVHRASLYFQIKTHKDMYNKPSQKSRKHAKLGKEGAMIELGNIGGNLSAMAGGAVIQQKLYQEPENQLEEPRLSITIAIATLVISTAFVGICAKFVVASINALTITGPLSKTFVGLILLSIVGNAAEHATAVTAAIKDKMGPALGVAIGFSMQIALLLMLLIVMLGWCIRNEEMTLQFDAFQIAVLFVAVLLVNYLIADGKSHWLEGVMLMTLYLNTLTLLTLGDSNTEGDNDKITEIFETGSHPGEKYVLPAEQNPNSEVLPSPPLHQTPPPPTFTYPIITEYVAASSIASSLSDASKIKKLNGPDDWVEWNRNLEEHLGMVDLWEILTGEVSASAEGTPEHNIWLKYQRKLKSLLLFICGPSALALIGTHTGKLAIEQYNVLKN